MREEDWVKESPPPGDRCGLEGAVVPMFRLRWFLDRLLKKPTHLTESCTLDAVKNGGCRFAQADAILKPHEIGPCEMAMAPDGQLAYFNFRPLTQGTPFSHEQTLATILLATEQVKSRCGTVRLRLSAYQGFEEDLFIQVPYHPCGASGGYCADIVLANLVEDEQATAGRCGGQDVDRHFELYDDAMGAPLVVPERPVGQRLTKTMRELPTRQKECEASNLYNRFAESIIRNGEHHQVCPMAAQ